MKIVIVSPSRKHLLELGAQLQGGAHDIHCVEGGKSHLRALAEQEQPDLLLADGMCCDPAELTQVEYVTTHFPATAVVLMCSAQTPEFLIHSMRSGVREVLPSPPPPEALHAAIARVAQKLAGPKPRTQGRILGFMPCKGGSGATFLATNLACELAHDRGVLLIDLNLQFGDALSYVHDGKPASTLADMATNIARLDASFLAASTVKVTPNFHVLPSPDDPGHAMEVKPEHIDAILTVAANHYDFILLDMGRSLDTLSIKALDRCNRIFPVLQASLPAIRHARKLMDVFQSLGYASDKAEPIVNRFDRTGEIDLDRVQRTLRLPSAPLALVEAAREVSASINHGEPLVTTARNNPLSRQLIEFARTLNPRQEEPTQRGVLGRIFRRA